MTWQPIETAPKDGTTILGFDAEPDGLGWGVVTMDWRFCEIDKVGYWSVRDVHVCEDYSLYEDEDNATHLTHWMPLPKGPEATP